MAVMEAPGSYVRLWKRRSFLSLAVGGSLYGAYGRGARLAPQRASFLDRATEFPVERLTNPAYSSFLPSYYGRFISKKGDWFLFWSDRNRTPQAFRMHLKTGEWFQLTDATSLDGSSLWLFPDEHRFCYFDGAMLRMTTLSNFRSRVLYHVPDRWQRGQGFAMSSDGLYGTFPEVQGNKWRLRLIKFSSGDVDTVVEAGEPLCEPMPRPNHRSILYRQGESFRMVSYDGAGIAIIATAPGRPGPALWSPDGRTVIYLHFPKADRGLNAIRELSPEAGTDTLVANTSQFVQFAANGDDSVFVGVSGSKASPYVLLLLRVTGRELTLCEHGASRASMVTAVFSPDSQQVYFHSDQQGKPAIYRVRVDKLVARTDT